MKEFKGEMKLPDKAIEAAAQALAHCAAGEHFTPDDPELDRQSWLPDARAALTAALPFLVPTREQIADAIAEHLAAASGWPGRGDKMRHNAAPIADAVLALIGASPCCAHPKCPGGSICCCQTGGATNG